MSLMVYWFFELLKIDEDIGLFECFVIKLSYSLVSLVLSVGISVVCLTV